VLRKKNWFFLLLISLALLASFTRSAWIFFMAATFFVLFKRQMYFRLGAFVMIIAASLILVPPLNAFLVTSISNLQGNVDPHSVGIKSFYTGVWARQESVLWGGSSVGSANDIWSQQSLLVGDVGATNMPESGYGWLVIKNGIPAYLLFVTFCVAGFIDLERNPNKKLRTVMQGVMLAILVVTHTSFYVFAFSASIVIWIIFGAAVVGYDPEKVPE